MSRQRKEKGERCIATITKKKLLQISVRFKIIFTLLLIKEKSDECEFLSLSENKGERSFIGTCVS